MHTRALKTTLYFILVLIIPFIDSAKPQATLKFPQYCAFYGYPTQTHIIPTLDGYNLKFFRLQAKNSAITDNKKVVYLQHGLADSSDTWVVNDEELAPGFALANQGYDIWVGNIRGNSYSSPQLSPKIKNFWDFSFDEMIQYDIPAAFSYIHNVTKKKIHYVGHSQGTLVMFGALSQNNAIIRPLIASFSALGPVAYLTNQESKLMSSLSKSPFIKTLENLQVKQLFYTNDSTKKAIAIACGLDSKACNVGLAQISEKNNTVNNLQRMPVVMGHFPSGTSLKNFVHFDQYVKVPKFCKYDYGKKLNLIKYGSETPPLYELKKIDFPVHMFVGQYDKLATVTDSKRLYDQLQNSPSKTMKLYKYGHATFIWGKSLEHVRDIVQIIESS